MNLKPIIALLMGLVIQLAQMQPCVAAGYANPVEIKAPSNCCCCDGLQSCPCISDRESDQQPTPLVPSAVVLKFLVSRAPGPSNFNLPIAPRIESLAPAPYRSEARRSYPGVTVAVAFCRFVI